MMKRPRSGNYLRNASELNVILDKYDIEIGFDWQEHLNSVSRYFEAN